MGNIRTAFRISLVLSALIAGTSHALAAMAPAIYAGLLDAAPYHVQVEIADRALFSPPSEKDKRERGADAWHGSCALKGRIAHIFRDTTGKLAVGELLSFVTPCFYEGGPALVGGTQFLEIEALKAARFVEAFLEPAGDSYQVAGYGKGIAIISAPTETPRIESRP